MKANGEDLSESMYEKFRSWDEALGLPSDEDLEYLSDRYGITMEDIYGPERPCPPAAILSPKDSADRLKEYIKGQDDAIDALSVPVFLHLDSMRRGYTSGIKSPVLLMGPTGSGKSELLRRCGELCDCPVIRINLSSVTAEGWRGTNISDIISSEHRAGIPLTELEYAIIVFNEFDKITHYGCKMVGESGNEGDFDMMRDVMRFFESGYSMPLGNGNDIVAGLTPMEPLSSDVIYEIMTSAKDNVVQAHIDFCAHHGINLSFDESALRCIADAAYKSGLGFRNVKTLLSKVMEKIYFELPDASSETQKRSVRISGEYVETCLCDTK